MQHCHDMYRDAFKSLRPTSVRVVTMSCDHHRSCLRQVEYIEFMKLMGVARFIICDESSDDDVHLLQACLAACHETLYQTHYCVLRS